MSKRSGETSEEINKRHKDSNKESDLAIDSELIAHQSTYQNNIKNEESNYENNREREAAASHLSNDVDGSVSSAVSSVTASLNKPMSIQPTTLPSEKPAPGSDEWHKLRRENHKEVEKRRRDNINSGIRELAALIPTSDTNKAQILQRAVEYIKRLKENETNNIEKWTLEKLLTEQAVSELDASNSKLKQELERAYREIEHYKRLAEKKE